MCGIVAFVDNEKPQIKDQLIKKMKDRIIHRGPDAEEVSIQLEILHSQK